MYESKIIVLVINIFEPFLMPEILSPNILIRLDLQLFLFTSQLIVIINNYYRSKGNIHFLINTLRFGFCHIM